VKESAAASHLRFAEAIRPRLRTSADSSVLEEVETRYAGLTEALEWLIEAGRADDALRLASTLVPFWMATKRIEDGDEWLTRCLAAADASPASRARGAYDHGYLVFWAGRYDIAHDRFVEARARADELGDRDLEALALAGSARVALTAEPAEAVRLLRRAVDLTADLPASAGRSSALHVLGVALQMSGDLEGAREVMRERLESGRSANNESIVFIESANLSMVERQLGNLDDAEALSRDAVRITIESGDKMALPWVLNGLAAVTEAKSDHERAAVLVGAAEGLLDEAGGEWPPDERAQYEETLVSLRAAPPADVERWRQTGRAMSPAEAGAFALAE
jgi:tetratricopeptide (TPR) repeat protein